MGRPEKPLRTDGGPVAEFAVRLRALRRGAGCPSYRSLATVAHYSAAVLSRAADGTRLPTWNVTSAYVRACRGQVPQWRAEWERAQASVRAGDGSPR